MNQAEDKIKELKGNKIEFKRPFLAVTRNKSIEGAK